jgi:hypothetical protein
MQSGNRRYFQTNNKEREFTYDDDDDDKNGV